MLMRRVVVCLDVKDGRVVKGVRFGSLRDVGDPAELAERYERDGADEIVFLDISASFEGRATLLDVARRTAGRLFIPLTIGGGIRSANDAAAALRAGADKIAINSEAVARPELITQAAIRFGSQCVVSSIDAKRRSEGPGWEVFVRGGRLRTGLDAVSWATQCAERGAGEILLTSIDRDGTRDGFDIQLTREVVAAVGVPVIASGGAGTASDIVDVLVDGGADAALVAGVLHGGLTTVGKIKELMAGSGLQVRRAA